MPKKPLIPHWKEKENPQGIGSSKAFEKPLDAYADAATHKKVRSEFVENVNSEHLF